MGQERTFMSYRDRLTQLFKLTSKEKSMKLFSWLRKSEQLYSEVMKLKY